MSDPVQDSILDAISRLDQAAANRFLGSLLAAEVSLQQLPVENFSYARDEHVRDGGVDGHLLTPGTAGGPFPEGKTKWQFKSGGSKPIAANDVLGETKKYLRDEIEAGADFVLAWTQSPPDDQQQDMRRAYVEAVQSVRSDARAYCFFGVQLAQLALRHPGVVADFGLSIFGSLLTMQAWEVFLRGTWISFLGDAARDELTLRLRTWSDSVEPPQLLHVFGNAGAGKSRTILEAFKTPGLSARVLYAPTPDSIPATFWPWFLGHPDARLCLVIDECGMDRLPELQGYASAAQGRLRIVTIGDRGPNRDLLGGGEFVELRPLAAGDMEKALTEAFGLAAEQATFVANLAAGYPGLAWSIVQVLRDDPTLDVTKLSRSGSVGLLLERMLPVAEHRELLGVLALFSNVGFEGDLAEETEAVCEIFDADLARFRAVVSAERDLIGATGRYRHVTPLLFAIWVGGQRLAALAGDLRNRLQRLPPGLFQRFQEQLENFGPNEQAKAVVSQLLEGDGGPFSLSDLAASARLLRACAAVDRRAVLEVVKRSATAHRAELKELRTRLDLGWTLEYLAWWPDTFRGALQMLFWLALDGVPEYTDQSSRHLTTLFHVHLGGTSVPLAERLDALEQIVTEENSDAARTLALTCLRSSLTVHETRMATTIRGGAPLPAEWRPAPTEVLSLRERALDLSIAYASGITDTSAREAALVQIAESLTMLLHILPGRVVLSRLEALDWPPKGRAKLSQSIHFVLAHESLQADYSAKLSAFARTLRGDSFEDLMRFVFAASVWELAEGRAEMLGTPAIIEQLADELVADEAKFGAALQLAATGESLTVGRVFERVGETTNDPEATYREILKTRPVAWAAIVGFLTGRERAKEHVWVTRALVGLAEDPDLLFVFPVALAGSEATDERANMALKLVHDGALRGRDLTRLRFGGWTLPLSADVVASLIEAMAADDDEGAVEAALAVLEHYTEVRPESQDRLRDLAATVLTSPRMTSPMSAHYRQQLMARLAFDYGTRLNLLLQVIEEDSPHLIVEADAVLFDGLIKEKPTQTTRVIVEHLVGDVKAHGWSKWGVSLEDFQFLGRAVGLVGKEPIAEALQGFNQQELASLLPHFRYEGDVPDPLLMEIIEAGSEDLRQVATGLYFQRPNGWTGSRVPILQNRRANAQAWASLGGPQFREWASSLLALYDKAIPIEEQSEAEFDANLG